MCLVVCSSCVRVISGRLISVLGLVVLICLNRLIFSVLYLKLLV